jgi:hypothetical protein
MRRQLSPTPDWRRCYVWPHIPHAAEQHDRAVDVD